MARYFDNIHGNAKLKSMLCSYIDNGTMPHAFIIEGAAGSGRKHIAKSIAAVISCIDKTANSIPCGKCINCEKIFKNVCPDVITVDSEDKKSIGVELIRELASHTYMTPNELDMKVYIIDGADTMTVQAQNAFLKTLEEPVTNVLYFLICENSKMLLPTIISRAPVVRTSPLPNELIASLLSEKHPELTVQSINEIVAFSHGNLGQALMYASDSESRSELTERRNEIYRFLDSLKQNNAKAEVFGYFTSESENNSALDKVRLLYLALRDIIAFKELKITQFDFFISSDEVTKYTGYIKPKFAKKVCSHIERSLSELFLNQGSTSVSSIMFSLAYDVWNARN